MKRNDMAGSRRSARSSARSPVDQPIPAAARPRHVASLDRQIAAVERELAKVDAKVKNAVIGGDDAAMPTLNRQRRALEEHATALRALFRCSIAQL
jgi:hypothetical protein